MSISFPVLIVLLAGILLVLVSLIRLGQRRLIVASLQGLFGLVLISVGGIFLLLALNIHTYQRLTYEKPVVSLTFVQTGPQQYRATLEYLDNHRREDYLLNGDEWQIDARILRWVPAFQLLGSNTLYRLERLNGRYSRIEEEQSKPRTVHGLAREQGLDLWTLAHDYRQWLKWLDAYFGSAAYLPMHDGARYLVTINQYGVIARPDNAPAEEAVSTWH